MLQKDAEPDWDSPTPDQLEVFETLKRKLVTLPILGLPKTNKPYTIDTDTSAYQLGATLLQKQNETKNEWTPIGYWPKTLMDTERNYSTTELECYSVVWAVTMLRTYIEGETFTVRTDHDALRWLMTLTDSSGRLMRWRIRLSKFDFTIQYRPGTVHQVPDALSRIISPQGNDDGPVDDKVPTYGDHENVLVTTRIRARGANAANETKTLRNRTPRNSDSGNARKQKQTTNAYEDDEQRLIRDFDENLHCNDAENEDEPLDEVLDDDLDIFDLAMAYGDDARNIRIIDVPVKITRKEVLDGQRYDDFCQTILARQDRDRDSAFFEGDYGILRRRHPTIHGLDQIVLHETLRPLILDLLHYSKFAGHPRQTRMYRHLRTTYYWPQMAADVYKTVRTCNACAKNRVRLRKRRVRLRKRTHPLRLFPARSPVEALSIDILGPLTKTKKGYRFLLVLPDRFTKLTQAIPLRRIDAYTVAVAFVEHWIFKYGPPRTLISDNGKQFAAKFFQAVCSLLGLLNIFTSTYHPQTNGQVERYNRTILAMLRNYVNEHQDDWDRYATALTYAYTNHVHRSMGTTLFSSVLSRPPPEFSLHHTVRSRTRPTQEQRNDYVRRIDNTIEHAYTRLRATQACYKRYFDKCIRKIIQRIRTGDYVYIDPTDGLSKTGKLQSLALGPFRVIRKDERTSVIDRNGVTERINADRLTYAPPPENTPTKEDNATTTERLEKNTDGLVDRLVTHRRTTDGTLEFLVRWYGCDEKTWEPRRNIPDEPFSRYFDKRKTNDKRLGHNEDTRRQPNVTTNKTRANANVDTN